METTLSSETETSFTNASTNDTIPDSSIESLTTGDIIYITVGIIGILDNAFALTVLVASKSLRRSLSTTFLIHQSLVDFISSVLLIASYDTNKGQVLTEGGKWTLAGELYCQLWGGRMFMWGFVMISTYNLLLLTLERYCIVVHPIWHRMTITRKKLLVAMAVMWITCMIFNYLLNGLSTPLVDGVCVLYSRWVSLAAARTMGILVYILELILPVGLMAFCYTRMIMVMGSKLSSKSSNKSEAAKGTEADAGATTAPDQAQAKAPPRNKISKNMMKTLITVCVCFFLCWVCNQTFFFLGNIGIEMDYNSIFYDFTIACALTNSCINPVIYVLQYRHFRNEALRLFCCKKPSAVDAEESRTGSIVA